MWGLAAALAALAGSALGGGPMWKAIAHVGAWINLFNLLPVWQLDGNRGFAALARDGRLAVAAAFAGGWMIAGDGLFFLLIPSRRRAGVFIRCNRKPTTAAR